MTGSPPASCRHVGLVRGARMVPAASSVFRGSFASAFGRKPKPCIFCSKKCAIFWNRNIAWSWKFNWPELKRVFFEKKKSRESTSLFGGGCVKSSPLWWKVRSADVSKQKLQPMFFRCFDPISFYPKSKLGKNKNPLPSIQESISLVTKSVKDRWARKSSQHCHVVSV